MKKYSFLITALTLTLDQLTKYLIEANFVVNLTRVQVNEYFNLVLVYNKGISFGLFNNFDYSNYLFAAISVFIILLLLKWLRNSAILSENIALGLVIGGALGNLIDRFLRIGVVDFIQLHWNQYYWPSFNIADCAIFLGVMILMFVSINLKDNKNEK
jgi:signal peptidase II